MDGEKPQPVHCCRWAPVRKALANRAYEPLPQLWELWEGLLCATRTTPLRILVGTRARKQFRRYYAYSWPSNSESFNQATGLRARQPSNKETMGCYAFQPSCLAASQTGKYPTNQGIKPQRPSPSSAASCQTTR